jgi:hypothetical protein
MADQVTVDNGGLTDYVVSADDAGAAGHVQRVKLAYGADGVATQVPADGDGLLVNLGTNNDVVISDGGNTITVDGTVAVTNAGLTELAAAIDTEVQVDVVAALPAGDNNIGNVDVVTLPNVTIGAAIPAGNNNIGDVDIASSVLPAGAATSAKQDTVIGHLDGVETTLTAIDGRVDGVEALLTTIDADTSNLSVVGGGTEAAALRVTIANNSTGVLSVDDNGGALTVDGTVTANLAAGTNNIGDVDVLSVVPGTGATNLGKAEDAAHTTADVGVYMLGVRDTAPAAHSTTDGDYESIHVSDEGGVWSAEVASSQGGTAVFRTLDADETEEDVKTSAGSVYGWFIYNDGAAEVYVKLYNATAANVTVGSTTPVMTIPVPAGSAANMAFSPGIRFDTAITIAATTGVADADTAAPAANQVIANIFYK